MNKAGIVFGFIIIMLAFTLSPTLLSAFDSWGYSESTTISAITTSVGVFSGNATLGNQLYNDNLDNVVMISSTNSSDTPAPASYSHATKALAVDGMKEDSTRSLTIVYRTARDDDFLATISPLMGILIILFLIIIGAGIAFVSWKKG